MFEADPFIDDCKENNATSQPNNKNEKPQLVTSVKFILCVDVLTSDSEVEYTLCYDQCRRH